MNGKPLEDMVDRELLIEVATDAKWLKEKLHQLCKEVYVEHNLRLKALEQHDAEQQAIQNERKDKTALAIAVAAIVLSAITSVANLIGG